MARLARGIHCELGGVQKPAVPVPSRMEPAGLQVALPRVKTSELEKEKGKIVLQPRLCTLRSYGEDRFGVVMTMTKTKTKTKTRKDESFEYAKSPFFETLSDYIDSSKKSRDFEIISGRLAMIVFATTVTTELVTGNSVFRKMDLQGIVEAGGVCLVAATSAAIFAWFSSARNRVGRIFSTSCNAFIDSLIDEIVDGLFYESEPSDWSDDI